MSGVLKAMCPYCGDRNNVESDIYTDWTFEEMECGNCGRTFEFYVSVDISSEQPSVCIGCEKWDRLDERCLARAVNCPKMAAE